jgi:hypothetical protein
MKERSLAGYLLLPRPGDLIKAWIFPVGFALGALAAGGVSGRDALRAAIVWIALELLLYQARYQWNDIRGFGADQRHPDRASRGRLPGPPARGRRHIAASALAAFARLALAALAAVALRPLGLAGPLLGLALAVLVTAALYEILRSRATGRSERVPPPPTADLAALWIVVGGGYAVRGMAGLALAGDGFSSPWPALAAAVSFWSFGIAFVTSRWALEALSFARLGAGGWLVWRVDRGQAREHTLALVRWLPVPGAAAATAGTGSLEDWRPLVGRVSLLAPWNLAAILAAAAAAATGCLLSGGGDLAVVAIETTAGGTFAALVLAPAPHRRRVLAWLAGGVALVAIAIVASVSPPLPSVLPWLCVVGAHLFFTAQSPRSLAHPVRFAAAAAREGLLPSRGERLPAISARR